MAIFVFILALLLAAAGGLGVYASVDLLPTEIGVLYASCGAMALCAAFIVTSIGVLIARVDRIGARVRNALAYDWPPEPVEEVHPVATAPTTEAVAAPHEAAVNENRTGHLPTIEELEETIAHPEPPAVLVGRYTAGGANYMIFSDGAIEAETEEGQFRFASMGAFKSYMKGRKGAG